MPEGINHKMIDKLCHLCIDSLVSTIFITLKIEGIKC